MAALVALGGLVPADRMCDQPIKGNGGEVALNHEALSQHANLHTNGKSAVGNPYLVVASNPVLNRSDDNEHEPIAAISRKAFGSDWRVYFAMNRGAFSRDQDRAKGLGAFEPFDEKITLSFEVIWPIPAKFKNLGGANHITSNSLANILKNTPIFERITSARRRTKFKQSRMNFYPSPLSVSSNYVSRDHGLGGISGVFYGFARGDQRPTKVKEGPESQPDSYRTYYENSERPKRHISLGFQIALGLISLAGGLFLFDLAFRKTGTSKINAIDALPPLSIILIFGGALAIAFAIAA